MAEHDLQPALDAAQNQLNLTFSAPHSYISQKPALGYLYSCHKHTHTYTATMGNANSQMLDSIVQGSNCTFTVKTDLLHATLKS